MSMGAVFRLDRTSPVPLYFQLSQQIETAIASGTLRPGEMIDTELTIAAKYGLSRPTVRQAIQDLVNKGLLVRKRGVGTQVVSSPMRRSVELTSLFDDLQKSHRSPSTRVLSLRTIKAPEEVARALELPIGAQILYLERLRSVDAGPLAVMRNWLPGNLIEMSSETLESQGLYDLIRSHGVNIKVAEQKIGATAASAQQAQLLKVKKGFPLLTMERLAYSDSGMRIEYSSHVYRSDLYSFETTVVAKS